MIPLLLPATTKTPRARGLVSLQGWALSARTLTTLAVAFGLIVRLGHYLYNHTIWYDESVLLFNILDKSFAQLVGPLDYAVAAPPIFVWLLKVVSLICGDSQYAWRAVPFAFSCATLVATVPLARRWVPAVWVPWVVALVAVSEHHIWLGCTIKPYASDAWVTTMLLLAYARTETWSLTRRLTALAMVAPFCLSFSYPSVFVLGAFMLALAPAAWRGQGTRAWLLAGLVIAGTFALLYFGPVKDQRVTGLVDEWERSFIPWATPLRIPLWLVENTMTVFQFAMLPSGIVLALVAPLGAKRIATMQSPSRLAVVVLPLALALVAAGVKAYPYGYNRLMLFVAPCLVILSAHSMQALLSWLPTRTVRILAIVILVVAAGPCLYHCVVPYGRPDSSGVKKYVENHRQPGDRVASNEPGYAYFFRGELLSLMKARALPPGTRLWVVMDHYNPKLRRENVTAFLAPTGFHMVEETLFRDSSAWLWVK